MSCCETNTAAGLETSATGCPECGATGSRVEPITLKALLNPRGLRKGPVIAPRFCATADCPVVYYETVDATTYSEKELTVRVHGKHPADGDVPVCYCFDVTPARMLREIVQTGKTTAREQVAQEVKAGRCACEVKNPKGACCLGDLVRVEREMLARLSQNVMAGPLDERAPASADRLSSGSDE